MPRIAAAAVCVAGALAAAAPGALAQGLPPYGAGDYGGFRNILPPGTNGLVDASQLALYEASKAVPPHNNDQLAMYSGLTTAAPNITAATLSDYYKDATFGVAPGDTGSVEQPEPGATIVRDARFGVPHIYGDTRAELMFAIGYATGEDRLFFIDVLRHTGRAELAGFAGGGNVGMDQSVWASEPYTEADLQRQVTAIGRLPDGPQIIEDATNYVAGINAYIAHAENPLFTGSSLPSEYLAIGKTPQPFAPADLVAIATLVGGIFGKGGGGQLYNAMLYEDLVKRFGAERYRVAGSPLAPPRGARALPRGRADRSGLATLESFAASDDPEAPSTVRGRRFPYQTLPAPSSRVAATVALPDPGSVHLSTVSGGSRHASADRGALSRGLLSFPRSMSNALLVSAAHSTTGRPIAVMGPQVSYFAPEILMEEDIHGPGIDADGAAFPGVNLYVELGHGPDYAWSATSSGHNIIDTFAVPLCNADGSPATLSSTGYVIGGRCAPIETLTRSESWSPNAADSTAPGQVTLNTERTAFGIVIARATVRGRPVLYTNLRSTYMHELDSAVGFERFNEPAQITTPQDFMNAAYHIGYTFNWFYVDNRHIAYFNSGLNPVRAPNTDPLFPTWSKYSWSGFDPVALTERQTPQSAHPQAIDQPYITSWNNKQAPGYGDPANARGSAQEFSSVFRSQLLDRQIESRLRSGHGRMTLVDLVNAMGVAGTQDLRGVEVLPYLLRVLGTPSDPALAAVVAKLRAWAASGAHRINRQSPGAHGTYEQGDAVRIMDAWWPLLIRAELEPVLGRALVNEIETNYPIHDSPDQHVGSAFDVGFYGIVQKDIRQVLGLRVRGRLNRTFCGNGSLAACRAALESSLRAAAAMTPAQVYPGDSQCKAGDQMCTDAVRFRAIGAVAQPAIEWVNRPTFQQAVEILGHRP